MCELVKLTKEDSSEITKVHILSFPNFFLTELGNEVLNVFYSGLIQDYSTIVWGVRNEEKLVGFFVASTSPVGLYSRIFRRHLLAFFLPLTRAFLRDFDLLKRMIISLKSSKGMTATKLYSVALLSICVSPSLAGKGIGKKLLNKLESELVLSGHYGYYLTTDKENNEGTNIFYLNNGFRLYGVLSQGKRDMNIYVKEMK